MISMAQSELSAVPTDINTRIARRVRELRADLGISLDDLSSRSDVSRSMLSLIEREETSATAVLLEKIAGALGVSLATLFEDSTAGVSPVSRHQDRVAWRDPQSGYTRRNISPANFPSPIQIVDIIFPAGATVSYETGTREVIIHQQVWVREGAIEVTVGKMIYRLAQDDCLAMQMNEPVTFRNRTRKVARYLVALTNGRARS
jgi:transcriptional regulator with XRE-family HTH domain